MWINDFLPSRDGVGILNNKGPGQFLIGVTVDYNKLLRLQPREYLQVHEEYEPQNDVNKY